MLTVLFPLNPQWVCVPFILMNPHTLDISQTLMNNSLHAPWSGQLELKNIFIRIDHFLFFVSRVLKTIYGFKLCSYTIHFFIRKPRYPHQCNNTTAGFSLVFFMQSNEVADGMSAYTYTQNSLLKSPHKFLSHC